MDYKDLFLCYFNEEVNDIDYHDLDKFMLYIEKIKLKLIHESIQRNRIQSIKWDNSKNVTACNKCYDNFGVFKRKHHCRSCGYVFCDKCSSYNKPCPILGYYKDVRHCEKCFYSISKEDYGEIENIRSNISNKKYERSNMFRNYDEV